MVRRCRGRARLRHVVPRTGRGHHRRRAGHPRDRRRRAPGIGPPGSVRRRRVGGPRRLDDGSRHQRPHRARCRRRRCRGRPARAAPHPGRPGFTGDDRLHVRHDWGAQGRDPHPPQLRRPGAQRRRRVPRGGSRGREHRHLPAARSRAGTRTAADLPRRRDAHRPRLRPDRGRRQPRCAAPHLPRGRAASARAHPERRGGEGRRGAPGGTVARRGARRRLVGR